MKYYWIFLALLSMFISGLGVIFLKYINDSNYDTNYFILLSFFFVGIISAILILLDKDKFIKKCKNYDYKFIFVISFFSILLLLNTFCMQYAILKSPNIGYTHAIINFNVVLSLIAGYFLFKQKINYKVFFGIIISLIGLSIIALNSN